MTGDRVPEFPQPPGTAEQAGQGEAVDPADSAAGPAEAVSTPGAAPTAWWSRGLVALVAVLTAGLVGLHLGATFLYNAPSNPVSQKYAGPLRDWMTPVFTQNWQLFAPNPLSEEIDVQARGSVAGSGQVTAWRDLSAADVQATVHNPVPGQVTLNALRNAVLEWLATHDAQGDPTAPNAATAQQYLSNMAVQRLTAQIGGTYSSIQVRLVFTLLPGPGRTAAQTTPQSRTLDWWVLPT